MSTFKLQTGPKTSAGKKRSSQNAIKTGVYAAKLLPGEFASNYAAMRDALINDYEAYDAIGLTAVEEFAMTAVRKNRVIQAEAQYLAGVMQTEEARKALAEKLHGSQIFARIIPWWYLKGGDCEEKKQASTIRLALNQLSQLKATGEPPTHQVIAFSYPALFEVVMWYQATSAETFWHVLVRETQKKHSSTCLDIFSAKLQKEWEPYIEWADNAHRYQRVVDMVYAEFAMRVMSKPEMIKLTNALNRQTEHALSVLHARDQLLTASGGALTVEVGDGAGSCSDVHVQVESSNGTQTTQARHAEEVTPVEGESMNAASEGVTIEGAAPKIALPENALPENAVPENALSENGKTNHVASENAMHANDNRRVASAEAEKVEPAKARAPSPEPRGDATFKKAEGVKVADTANTDEKVEKVEKVNDEDDADDADDYGGGKESRVAQDPKDAASCLDSGQTSSKQKQTLWQ